MKKTLYMMKGLPGSGKTTAALKMMQDRTDLKRVNRDDIRAMVDDGRWSGTNEKFVKNVRDMLIEKALTEGYSVVCDDTNLHPGNPSRLRQLAETHGAEFVVIPFTDIDIETCIERDLKRDRSVGERVIRDMHRKFLSDAVQKPPQYDPNLFDAIIVDIDGTLALKGERSPFDWDRVDEDELNKPIFEIISRYQENVHTIQNYFSQGRTFYIDDNRIILVSGRDSCCRDKTELWLKKHGVPYTHLYMRPEGNNEKDAIIKRRIYDEHIRGKYNVKYVFDDRNQTVSMWRSLGLTCLQVAEGNF